MKCRSNSNGGDTGGACLTGARAETRAARDDRGWVAASRGAGGTAEGEGAVVEGKGGGADWRSDTREGAGLSEGGGGEGDECGEEV